MIPEKLNNQQPASLLLSVSDLKKSINNNLVVNDITFEQESSKKIAIAGETGSGKSTLLKMISGLVQPDSGKIYFEQRRVMGPDYQLVAGEPGIAYLSQHYELRNHYRMEELLSYANNLTDKEAQQIYRICEIDHLLQRNTFQLSGGEKQRIALARLLVGTPRLLLLDEPFSNLDLIHKNILKSVIEEIGEKLNISCILTSHDPLDTLSWADEIMVMQHGQIIQQGAPLGIYMQPISEYVAGLFGRYNIIDTQLAGNLGIGSGEENKAILLRPEFFNISEKPTQQSISGVVEKMFFWGGYYEVQVRVNNDVLLIRSLSGHYTKGAKVYISAEKDKVCYMKS